MERETREKNGGNPEENEPQVEYVGNMFGKKHTIYALIIILLFLGVATCRYLMIRPAKFILDPDDPIGMLDCSEYQPEMPVWD